MFDNLKAFIRHGRQANDLKTRAVQGLSLTTSEADLLAYSDSTNGASVLASDLENSDLTSGSSRDFEEVPKKTEARKKYDEVANKLVEEEKQNRNAEVKYPNLEKYQVLEKMGEGAFSVVYKARHLESGNLVAIKILRKYQMDNAQKQAVFKEVIIMRQLNHPHVVKFIEFIESEPYYYIVQELVPGGEIFGAIVNYTYLSENLARHVIYQVADAVRYLHEEVGIVHRDIKPENLLFCPIEYKPSLNPIAKLRRSDDPKTKKDEGEFLPGVGGGTIGLVKLADFGLSKQIWEHNTKTPCGTVGYTAPEIVRDERYSKEVDMWAIGCVLYTLLCGFPPFYDERIETLTEKVARGEYSFLAPWWDEISIDAKYCVSRLLTVDPKRRYTIEEFFEDPWIRQAAPTFEKPMKAPRAAQPVPPNYNNGMYSPAALALREAFDISAAVHRIGEEAALNKTRIPDVVEEDEEMEVEPLLAIPRDINMANAFELNLGGASILERRKKLAVAS
ncbi:CIC11C00000000810 [Sungouiella intermedia]|uniref:CIC11C00000000810 n=1 Tax=Sungouiella intermedia TaxID=45354 RepID=A0A1L0BBU7_9ASCO|nr:CIC11C00000000810 [[Candida] intermedia]